MKIQTHQQNYFSQNIQVEYTTTKINELEEDLRIDSNFYLPEFVRNEEKIKNKKWEYLENFLDDLYRYPTFFNIKYLQKGILILKGENISNNGIIELKEKTDFISEKTNKKFYRTILKEFDLIMSVRGVVGKVGLITKEIENSNINANVIKLKLNGNISKLFIWCYLNSNIGKDYISRITIKTLQETIISTDIKKLKIPIPTNQFQNKIEELVKKAYSLKENSKNNYEEAENILLEELNLKNFSPKKIKVDMYKNNFFEINEFMNIKKINEIKNFNRFDSEFYLKEYEEIEKKILDYEGGFDLVKNLTKNFSGFAFSSENYKNKGIQIIRIQNISSGKIDLEKNKIFYDEKEFEKYKNFQIQYKDILLGMTGATIGRCSLNMEKKKLLLNQRVLAIRKNSNKINDEFLHLYLDSFIFQKFIKRECGGGAQENISQEFIENLKIPLIKNKIQEKIKDLIENSQQQKENSKKLLEISKKAVEIFIEENEEKGLKYILENLK